MVKSRVFFEFPSGPGSSKLGVRTTMGIVAGRLVLVPLGGIGIVSLADKLGFLPSGNKMFKFVLLLQHSMPTSILSGNHLFPNACDDWLRERDGER